MKLSTLLTCLPFFEKSSPEDPDIVSLSHHHEDVVPGTLFIALKGIKNDGRQYVRQAIDNGAVAIVTDQLTELSVPVIKITHPRHALAALANRFYGYPSHDMTMIGVTGTNGKTTVTHMIDSILREHNERTGIIGTLYIKHNDHIKPSVNTTPDSLLLQQTLREFASDHVTSTVIEVSSHGLSQGRLYGCDMDIAVFTNVTQDHLDYHGTMDHYKWSKSLLFSQLGHRHFGEKMKFAILNADDPFSETLKMSTSAYSLTYGLNRNADVYAVNIQQGVHSTTFDVHTPVGHRTIRIPVVGVFNVYNALAAIATAIAKSVPFEAIQKGLEAMRSVPGRFELVDANQPFTVIVDYAHTPDSLKNVLKAIHTMGTKKIFTVVGCGGDRDKSKRPKMAEIACSYATDVVFTSDNPRSESPLSIIRDMEEGVKGQQYTVLPDRREAIEYALNQAGEGDIVLIAGKGHETVQIIGDRTIPFDDKQVARDILRTRHNQHFGT